MYNARLREDWNFTNSIHSKLVEPLFLEKFNMTLEQANLNLDQKLSIDYIGHKNNHRYSFQERIRRSTIYTENSQEFTLRFQRNQSFSSLQKQSEFFKIKSQFLFYAILNKDETDFQKYCIINIKNLLKYIDEGSIIIDENKHNKHRIPYVKNSKTVGILKNNHEKTQGNSSFVIFNLGHIAHFIDKKKDKKDKIVLVSEGYIVQEQPKNKNVGKIKRIKP